MHATRRPSSRHSSLSWLLWLALLLPLAQAAAVMHGYSHVHTDASSRRDADQAPQASHCDLCLTAASLASGALPAGAASLPVAAGPGSAPLTGPGSVWRGLTSLGYRSRAPPFSLH